MKYKHRFHLENASDTHRIYRSENNTVRLDFMEHMLRVAILRDGEPLIPTYTVRPRKETDAPVGEGLPDASRSGRDKLSTEDFRMLAPKVTEDEESVSFCIDDVSIRIRLLHFQMSFSNANGLLFEDRSYISYNFNHELGYGSTHFITREADERIFGLGDKAGTVNKNKMRFHIATSDAMGFDASSSDPLYKQLPFYICQNSNGAYGIYYDTYSNGEMNFGKEINNYYGDFKSFRCEEENLVFYVIFGSVSEILQRFSLLCGPLLFPPRWTYAYAGSTMSYTDADNADEQLRNFVSLCETHDLHAGGFYLSSGYTQIGDKRYVFHWNTDKIPSPEGLSQFFKEHGISFFPNVKPAFLINHPLYEKIASKGWFLHYADGTPAIFPFWDDYGSYLDFTHPQAYRFWTDCVKEQLVDKGYGNIWNDNNEYDICDKEVYAHGFDAPVKAHLIRPLFSFLMTMASLEAQDKSIRTVSVSRSGIAGLGRLATTWTGDNRTDFSDFRYNHYMAMTMSLSGFYNFGQDIGGFAGPRPDKELFLRWIQYGIFTPRFVLHSWNDDGSSTMPWLYPDKTETVKKLFALRNALVPYLYNESYRSACEHLPIIYPVFLTYPNYDTESDVFFFGNHILAAPVFDKGATSVSVLLPENNGDWYYHDMPYKGEVTISNTIDDLPVYFIKGGSVIPWQDSVSDWNCDNLEHITFTIYPMKEGRFTYKYLVDDGVHWLTKDNHRQIVFHITCEKDCVYIKIENGEHLRLKMVDALQRKPIVCLPSDSTCHVFT